MAPYDNGAMMGLGAAMLGIGVVFLVGLYVYMAFVFMTIARKLKYDKPWLAWIPVANMFLLPILANWEWPWGFLMFVPIVNVVFMVIWLWKIYEKRKYPGALSLLAVASIIPFIGWLAGIGHIVVLGMVAWADRK